jgi:hypothetical protein
MRDSTTLQRSGRPGVLLVTGILLAAAFAGCSSSSESGGTEVLSRDCRNADISAIESAASQMSQAQKVLEASGASGDSFTSATVEFLNKGSVFFSVMATKLDTLFGDLSKSSGESDLITVIDDFNTTADEFTALSAKISNSGTVTGADISAIVAVGPRFDRFAVAVDSGSPTGDMLKEIPDCKTFLRNLDLVTQNISAADGIDELDGDN